MAEALQFAKMHALGNDFVVLDRIRQPVELTADKVRAWADRRRGIGFDQLLTLDPPHEPDEDFSSRIYNADGSEAQNCYNGARCLALLARARRHTLKPSMIVGFTGGSLSLTPDFADWKPGTACTVSLETAAVELNPGPPLFAAEAVSGGTIGLGDWQLQPSLVSVGNPHALVELSGGAHDPLITNLRALGDAAQQHPWFPQGVNLSLMERRADSIRLWVYERGVGPTPACGTAAVAAGALALHNGWWQKVVRLRLDGGDLQVEKLPDAKILLKGEACISYTGSLLS